MSTPDGSCGTLRQVVSAAQSGATIVIDPGVEPALSSGITVGKSLTIEGQDARSTTITGDAVHSTLDVEDVCKCGPTLTTD